jgi:hypothetical protein
MQVIWVGRESKYFWMKHWTTQITLTALAFLFATRMAYCRPVPTHSFIVTSSAMQRQHRGRLGRWVEVYRQVVGVRCLSCSCSSLFRENTWSGIKATNAFVISLLTRRRARRMPDRRPRVR